MAEAPATEQILEAIAECKDDDMRALLRTSTQGSQPTRPAQVTGN